MARSKTSKTVSDVVSVSESNPHPNATENVESSFERTVTEIIAYTKLGMNAMLIGRHGVGKTAAIQEACRREGWNMWYASAPLLDPDIDLGGIPVPNKTTKTLDFFTQPHLQTAEVLFLDELNRASPRTLNMVFELIQFKSVHGKRLPNLRVVHTGINPPGEGAYDVQVLDEALMDRFHAFIDVKHEFPSAVIVPILGEAQTSAMEQWYTQHLTDVFVSPRRMVYAAEMHKAGMPLERAFTNPKIPVGRLKEMLLSVAMPGVTFMVPDHKKNWTPSMVTFAEKHGAIWLEPEAVEKRERVDLVEENKEMARILKELNITAEQVWDEVARLREANKR